MFKKKGFTKKINRSFMNEAKKVDRTYISHIITALIIFAMLIGLNDLVFKVEALPTWQGIYNLLKLDEKPPASPDAELKVHFIDVGQGDSQLIQSPEYTVLIDGGESDQAQNVINYINNLGIKKLDYVVVTHFHSDHMGGMSEILNAFKVGRIIFPETDEYFLPLPTTRAFVKMLETIEQKQIPVTYSTPNHNIFLGENISLTLLAPVTIYDDMNNVSIVSKLVHGENSFLFTGDIEAKAESDILGKHKDLGATVLSSPHHGSRTSSSSEFIDAVSPQYTVIQCGANNSYGHPHKETLETYNNIDTEILRSDLLGNIVFASDGKGITITSAKGEYASEKGEYTSEKEVA